MNACFKVGVKSQGAPEEMCELVGAATFLPQSQAVWIPTWLFQIVG